MKIAYLSDVHGNLRALEAVLDDIQRQSADVVICGGDIVNPYLASLDVLQRLRELGIPILRGNHEDYIALFHDDHSHVFLPEPRSARPQGHAVPDVRTGVQFQPVHHVARHLGRELARELTELPFALRIPGPGGDDVWACHASPLANNLSYRYVMNAEMEHALAQVPARTLISGHIHLPWQGEWRDKLLVVAGSVGIPMSGKPEPEYTLLSHHSGRWQVEHRTVEYDHAGALREFRETALAHHGGPIAWLLYDEILCAQKRLAMFLPRLRAEGRWPTGAEAWADAARGYLREHGRWDEVAGQLGL